MTDLAAEGVVLHLQGMSKKANYPSRLLQEVIHLGYVRLHYFLYFTLTRHCNFVCQCTPWL
jgi:hypothetical protein